MKQIETRESQERDLAASIADITDRLTLFFGLASWLSFLTPDLFRLAYCICPIGIVTGVASLVLNGLKQGYSHTVAGLTLLVGCLGAILYATVVSMPFFQTN